MGTRSLSTNQLFLLHPGVAIAAKHVVEGFLPRLVIHGGAFFWCTSISAAQAMIWQCRKITIIPDTYASELPPEHVFRIACITTRLPRVGEQVSMVGPDDDRDSGAAEKVRPVA